MAKTWSGARGTADKIHKTITLHYYSGKTNLKDHVRTMFWPLKGNILAIFRKRGHWDTPRFVKFGMDHTWAH